jgi:hypothetical protein
LRTLQKDEAARRIVKTRRRAVRLRALSDHASKVNCHGSDGNQVDYLEDTSLKLDGEGILGTRLRGVSCVIAASSDEVDVVFLRPAVQGTAVVCSVGMPDPNLPKQEQEQQQLQAAMALGDPMSLEPEACGNLQVRG